jgi:hypothetical protein
MACRSAEVVYPGQPSLLIRSGRSDPDAKLHRTTDPATATKLCRRSVLLAVIGTVLLIGATIVIKGITTV